MANVAGVRKSNMKPIEGANQVCFGGGLSEQKLNDRHEDCSVMI